MRTLSERLEAGVAISLPVDGTFFTLLESAAPLDIDFEALNGRGVERGRGLEAGYWFEDLRGIVAIKVTSPVAQTIKYACSFGRGGYDLRTVTMRQASAITNLPTVTVGAVAAEVVGGDNTRKGLVFLWDEGNAGRVALGGPDVTFGNACIILEPGDDWPEDNAAAAPWYAVTESGTGTMRIEERR